MSRKEIRKLPQLLIEKTEGMVSCERTTCFNESAWFIEGNHYCDSCKLWAIDTLKEIYGYE